VETITIDGVNEEDFRRSIEDKLRRGDVDEAAARLRALLEPYAGDNQALPSRFLSVSPDEIEFAGWEGLVDRLDEHGRPDHPISAVSIAIADPGEAEPAPDESGRSGPCIETSYFSDAAYPFSEATIEDLLDGYSGYGCQWQGDFEGTDRALTVKGLDDLYGAIAELEERLLNSSSPGEDEIRAGSLGACYLAVLIHQAVRDMIRKNGLPRPLCVMTGCNGVYPFFDAPVAGSVACSEDDRLAPLPFADDADQASVQQPAAIEMAGAGPGEASLLGLVSRKGKKRPVLVLDPEEARKAARLTEFAGAQLMADVGRAGRASQPHYPPPSHAAGQAEVAGTWKGQKMDLSSLLSGMGEVADPADSIPSELLSEADLSAHDDAQFGEGAGGGADFPAADTEAPGLEVPEVADEWAGPEIAEVPEVPVEPAALNLSDELVLPDTAEIHEVHSEPCEPEVAENRTFTECAEAADAPLDLAEFQDMPEEASEQTEIAIPEAEPQPAKPVAASGRHSLRNRIIVQDSKPRVGFWDRVARFFRWIMRLLSGSSTAR